MNNNNNELNNNNIENNNEINDNGNSNIETSTIKTIIFNRSTTPTAPALQQQQQPPVFLNNTATTNDTTTMSFSKEQMLAFQKYRQGQNVFITGPGGSGKTVFIRALYKDALLANKKIQVCSTTGCSSVLLNCNAKTIHSWAGIGLGNSTKEDILHKILRKDAVCKCWKNIDILVIDEISMMSFKLLSLLDFIARNIRRSFYKPMGGIQVIFSGDFYQLPPVNTNQLDKNASKFCFEFPLWNEIFPPTNQIQFISIYRQTDPIFTTILNEIRNGTLTPESINILQGRVGIQIKNLNPTPTRLFPVKRMVENINQFEMNKLKTGYKVFQSKHLINSPTMTPDQKRNLRTFTVAEIEQELTYMMNNLLCEPEMTLKINAQVMCVVNLDITGTTYGVPISNGTQGIVVALEPNLVVNFQGKEVVIIPHFWESELISGIGITQIPLILSWAITIHKSQGMTLDTAEIDAGQAIFESGQSYVGMSRVKSLEGLYLRSFDPNRITVNPKVKEFYDGLCKVAV